MSAQWFEFYEQKHQETLEFNWNYNKLRGVAKDLRKIFPKRPIYVVFDANSKEEAHLKKGELIKLDAIEIEDYPQPTYVLSKERELEVREIFKDFNRTVVIEDSGGVPAFLYYARLNWTTLQRIVNKIGRADEKILDVGCGEGSITTAIAKRGKQVVGLDISPTRALRLRKLMYEMKVGVHIVIGDAEHLPFKESFFDTVVCSHTIDHIPDDGKALKEAFRVLRDEGSLILTSQLGLAVLPRGKKMLERELPDELGHCHRYSLSQLKGLLSGVGFKVQRSEGIGGLFYVAWSERLLRTWIGRVFEDILYLLSRLLPVFAPRVVIQASAAGKGKRGGGRVRKKEAT
ncbi:class I SAM-dependent methyltransferase [Chloroflexota bacterium]